MKKSTKSHAVRATYRVQLHPGFGFDQAAKIARYLAELGVSHLYASPYLQAAKGSTHGYDVVDYGSVNVELGGREAHARMSAELAKHGLGQVLDIVPNHMAIGGPENAWWWDVLKNGKSSHFARYFDIYWGEGRTPAKILAPILGSPYGKALAAHELKVVRSGSTFVVRYYDQALPLSPASVAWIASHVDLAERDASRAERVDAFLAELNRDPARLDELLEKQHYRIAYWRHAANELNYRCFFDISKLVALRQEDEAVFDDSHALVLEWLADETLDGVRIDHVDGLRDPVGYLEKLHERAPQAWIVVEKILEAGEELPRAWPIAGTTGYEFVNLTTSLFVDPDGERPMTDLYATFSKRTASFQDIAYEKKLYILKDKFGSEVGRLTELLTESATRDWRLRDVEIGQLRDLVNAIIACFPVYRTYARLDPPHAQAELSEQDRRAVETAFKKLDERRPDIDEDLKSFLKEILLLRRRGPSENELVMQFQQLTVPVMAKGIEDTAFYCYHRFLALNEVGGDPSRFGVTLEQFHATVAARRRSGSSMLATSTHDTKRSEDVRARLALLSEIPALWASAVVRFSKLAERHKQSPDAPEPNTEYLFWQTVVGAYPIDPERAARYMLKACREAKGRTAWVRPDTEYEEGVIGFVTSVLSDDELMAEVNAFAAVLVEPGRLNALSQKLVALTAPGVPDIYQGTELWDLSLVDPDNRHPVSFELRHKLLRELPTLTPEDILRRGDEGLPKLSVVAGALDVRRRAPSLFGVDASYEPLFAQGARAEHVVAFARAGRAVTVVPRLVMKLAGDWRDTILELPRGTFRNVFTGEDWRGRIELTGLLARFPVALLVASA
jgi:(1->4)-alpha-D-glucan 1-alpha-D-glucosylmutase